MSRLKGRLKLVDIH